MQNPGGGELSHKIQKGTVTYLVLLQQKVAGIAI